MSPSSLCPLCETLEPRVIAKLESTEILSFWRDRYDIDVIGELEDVSSFTLLECQRCALRWALPPVTGSPDFYARLQTLPWYYMENKWEHLQALSDLPEGGRVLEVGAGSGHFVAMAGKAGFNARGIEMNESGVEEARKRGLRVDTINLFEVARDEPGAYDAVCAFQVLEHVPDPGDFAHAMRRVLRPGGVMILSVPSLDSFLRHAGMDPMNMPPHHLTHWTSQTFRALAETLELETMRIDHEPLARYHVDWFLSVQCGRLPAVPFLRGAARRMLGITVGSVLKTMPLRKLIRGHTLYGAFRKKR